MKSILDVQNFIDQSIDLLDGRDISAALYKQADVPDSERDQLECEKQCMFCMLQEDDPYPIFSEWKDSYYHYLIDRAANVNHDKLISKYNTILYHGDKKFKRQDQAEVAIDSFIRIIRETKYKEPPGELCSEWGLVNILCNVFRLSIAIRQYKAVEIKVLVHDLIYSQLSNDSAFQYVIISRLLEHPKLFKAADLVGLDDILENIVSRHWQEDDYFLTPNIIETGLKIGNRLARDEKKWYNLLGKNYELFAEKPTHDKTGMAPLLHISKAVIAYKKAGNGAKVEELGARYAKLKNGLRLAKVRMRKFKDKEKEMADKLNAQIEVMLAAGAEAGFKFLMRQLYLPDEALLAHIYSNAVNVFLPDDLPGLLTRVSFDINKNIKAQPETDQEKLEDQVSQAYLFHVNVTLRPLLASFFYRGIESKVLRSESFLDVLSATWIGTQLVDIDSGGESNEYNWLELLSPSIQILFSEFEKGVQSNDYQPVLIPAIDSLVLKFEGMLRDLAWAIGADTIKINRSNAMQEKTLEELLGLEKLKNSFDPEDLLFFRYVYTNFGLNLRNNIGHGFFRAYHYSPHYGYLILLSILGIAKYEVREEEPIPEGN